MTRPARPKFAEGHRVTCDKHDGVYVVVDYVRLASGRYQYFLNGPHGLSGWFLEDSLRLYELPTAW